MVKGLKVLISDTGLKLELTCISTGTKRCLHNRKKLPYRLTHRHGFINLITGRRNVKDCAVHNSWRQVSASCWQLSEITLTSEAEQAWWPERVLIYGRQLTRLAGPHHR